MANTKEYKIVINGLTESINAVDALNKQLDKLEQRMNTLSSSRVSTGGGSSTSNNALSEEEKIQKQIEQIEEKRIAHSKEIYQNYLSAKDALKEVEKNQKAIVAGERVQTKTYANTIAGMKQELADIKATMQTVDLGDTEQLDKMTKRANELNDALKKIEYSYGQFGRNVGNYASAAEGFKGLAIQVGDMVQNFDNAKQAMKELKKEMTTLATKKDLGLISEEEAKRLKDLIPVVAQLESSIKDAGKPMDALLDGMQSFVAVTQSFKGIGAFFGMDSAETEKTIKNLVALQNAMQGLQTIQKQINTREGIGAWIAPFTTGVDKATAKLLVYNRALLGTGKAAKAAAVGINLFSKALKIAFTGGILIAVDLLVEKLMDLVESFKKVDKAAENTKKTEEEMSKAYAEGSATLLKYQTIVNNFNGSKKEEERLVKRLNSELGSSLGTYKTLAEWTDVLTNKGAKYVEMLVLQAKAQAAFNNLVNAQTAQNNAKNASTEDYRTFLNDIQDFLWTGWGDSSANKARVAAIQSANEYTKTCEEEFRKAQSEVEKFMETNHIGDYSTQLETNAKGSKKKIEDVEGELARARISAMKEGLNKTILQLEEERKQRLSKINRNAKDYKQQEAQWNQYYNDRILDETEKWSKKMQKVYVDLYSAISSYAVQNLRMVSTETANELQRALKQADDLYSNVYDTMAGYSPFGGMKISPETQKNLGLVSFIDSKEVNMVKELITLEREYKIEAAEFSSDYAIYWEKYRKFKEEEQKLDEETKKAKIEDLQEEDRILLQRKAILEKHEADIKNYRKYIKETWQDGSYDEELFKMEFNNIKNALLDEGYLNDLSDVFKARLAVQKTYWTDVERITKVGAENEKKARLAALDKERQEEDATNLAWRDKTLQDTKNYYKELREGYDTELKRGLMTKEMYLTKTKEAVVSQENDLLDIQKEYENRMKNITKKYESDRQNIIKESGDKVKKVTIDELNQRMTEMRDFQTQINNLEQKQPVMNVWGITNWAETKRNNQQIKDSYIELANELSKVRKKALEVLGDKNASKEFKDQAESVLREARNMAAGIGETLEELEYKMSNWAKTQTFFQDIQMYFQEVVNSFNTIMSAVWNAQDVQFDKEQEQLDKENEMLANKLKEQEDIVSKHKSAIDSIEDELATARGDRRQHLIDQLNAEMTAQREAAKQQKKIEEEQARQQAKADDLEKKRKKAQYQRDLLQAIVNGAMAVTYAAMNTWPIPAIPMMALAASTTAAQVAIMASNKPYAKGGQLDGPSHREGGIKVPGIGGGIELEGQEYVIRKKSAAKNLDILGYINRSERKLSLDDFIDFYGGKVKKNVKSMSPGKKFADGGALPTLSNTYDFDDRLLSAFEDYSNRQVVVSVVDINNRQAAVRNVQVLAGVEND